MGSKLEIHYEEKESRYQFDPAGDKSAVTGARLDLHPYDLRLHQTGRHKPKVIKISY